MTLGKASERGYLKYLIKGTLSAKEQVSPCTSKGRHRDLDTQSDGMWASRAAGPSEADEEHSSPPPPTGTDQAEDVKFHHRPQNSFRIGHQAKKRGF